MKKIIAISLCVILALCCMFACTSEKKPEPTAEPTTAPTSEPTAEPTATPEPTAAPTENPLYEKKNAVKGIVTDMSEEIPVEQFSQTGVFSYEDGIAYASITNPNETGDAYISFRLYDPRYVEEGTGLVSDDPVGERTLANAQEFPIYAIKYRVTGEAVTARDYAVCSWWHNVLSDPTDIIPYANHELKCDNEWHTVIINIQEECPVAYAACAPGTDDAFDCLLFSCPADADSQIDIAWYGCFESIEEVNEYDATYSELFASEVSVSVE